MLNLAIQHFIYLTRAQRYALHEGIELVVVGVSIPVWFLQRRTSEPAKEIFCKYHLKNPHHDQPIQILDDGYEVSLPYREGQPLCNDKGQPLSDEEWRVLNATNPDKLNELYHKHVTEVSSRLLLDSSDGGNQLMAYREHNKIRQENSELSIIHYVNLLDMERLTSTLVERV